MIEANTKTAGSWCLLYISKGYDPIITLGLPQHGKERSKRFLVLGGRPGVIAYRCTVLLVPPKSFPAVTCEIFNNKFTPLFFTKPFTYKTMTDKDRIHRFLLFILLLKCVAKTSMAYLANVKPTPLNKLYSLPLASFSSFSQWQQHWR